MVVFCLNRQGRKMCGFSRVFRLTAFRRETSSQREMNELIAHEWLSLETLWRTVQSGVADAGIRERIDQLFPTNPVWKSGPEEWHRLNAAEQAIGSVLSEPQLTTEFDILLEMAKQR